MTNVNNNNLRETVKENLVEEILSWTHVSETQPYTFGHLEDGTVTGVQSSSFDPNWVAQYNLCPAWFNPLNEDLEEDDLTNTVEYILDTWGF